MKRVWSAVGRATACQVRGTCTAVSVTLMGWRPARRMAAPKWGAPMAAEDGEGGLAALKLW